MGPGLNYLCLWTRSTHSFMEESIGLKLVELNPWEASYLKLVMAKLFLAHMKLPIVGGGCRDITLLTISGFNRRLWYHSGMDWLEQFSPMQLTGWTNGWISLFRTPVRLQVLYPGFSLLSYFHEQCRYGRQGSLMYLVHLTSSTCD